MVVTSRAAKTRLVAANAAKLLDGMMGAARVRVRRPRVLEERRLTSAEVRDVASKVSLRHVGGKGLGLVARRALPAHTRVGVYGGKVFGEREHQRLTDSGLTTGKYAVDFFRRSRGAGGGVREGYLMDPGAADGMHPRHANVLAAFINEPGAGQVPNTVWVRNYDEDVLELWTSGAVARGEELTVCYAAAYPRAYKTPCTSKPGVLHYWRRGMRVPVEAASAGRRRS